MRWVYLTYRLDHSALRGRTAQGIESIGLQLIKESLVVLAGDRRIISAAGQLGARSGASVALVLKTT